MGKTGTSKVPKTNALIAVSVYIILSLGVFLYGAFSIDIPLTTELLLAFSGLLFFTLSEYLFHRFLYHSGENYKDEKNWQYTVHGIHHVHPRDQGLLAMPIPLAIALAVFFFFLFYLVMDDYAFFFWSGFFFGYASYLFIHFKIHSRRPPKNIFGYLWKHHSLHHYIYEDKAFGVSSPLWDIIFGTMPPKKERHSRRQTREASISDDI